MRIVIALGGNALAKRGEPMTVEAQRANVQAAAEAIGAVSNAGHEVVVTHGNGPQVGLLALQASAYGEGAEYPFDVLGAATEGMIGYLIEQELGNVVPVDQHVITVLTQTEVSADDPAFADPTKFVGPVYTEEVARRLAAEKGWTVKPDGAHWRRVVPSPAPVRIFEVAGINLLLAADFIVVTAGGGGIPTMFDESGQRLRGVEAVIDKDRAAAVLARDLRADLLLIATDADGVFLDWGGPNQRLITAAHPAELGRLPFPAGSMGPKVEAAIAFANSGAGRAAVIGSLDDLSAMLDGRAGTRVSLDVSGLHTR
nr:carbamate kinase [Propionibacterium sp.]